MKLTVKANMNSESCVSRMKICLIRENQKGFSLAESLVALVILGLFGAVLTAN